jgi:hypothetical protein
MALTSEHFLAARKLVGPTLSSLHLGGLHLAAARAGNLPLLTADQDLAKAAKRHKSAVLLIE